MEISRGKVIAMIVLVGLIVATCKVLHGGLREVLFPQAFLRGYKWLELGYNERGFYVMGLCDGLSMSVNNVGG